MRSRPWRQKPFKNWNSHFIANNKYQTERPFSNDRPEENKQKLRALKIITNHQSSQLPQILTSLLKSHYICVVRVFLKSPWWLFMGHWESVNVCLECLYGIGWVWKLCWFSTQGFTRAFKLPVAVRGDHLLRQLGGACPSHHGSGFYNNAAVASGLPFHFKWWFWSQAIVPLMWGFPGGSDNKESACSAGDLGLIPEWGRFPGEGNGNPLSYSCLENSMDKRAWGGYSLWGCKELGMTEQPSTHT